MTRGSRMPEQGRKLSQLPRRLTVESLEHRLPFAAGFGGPLAAAGHEPVAFELSHANEPQSTHADLIAIVSPPPRFDSPRIEVMILRLPSGQLLALPLQLSSPRPADGAEGEFSPTLRATHPADPPGRAPLEAEGEPTFRSPVAPAGGLTPVGGSVGVTPPTSAPTSQPVPVAAPVVTRVAGSVAGTQAETNRILGSGATAASVSVAAPRSEPRGVSGTTQADPRTLGAVDVEPRATQQSTDHESPGRAEGSLSRGDLVLAAPTLTARGRVVDVAPTRGRRELAERMDVEANVVADETESQGAKTAMDASRQAGQVKTPTAVVERRSVDTELALAEVVGDASARAAAAAAALTHGASDSLEWATAPIAESATDACFANSGDNLSWLDLSEDAGWLHSLRLATPRDAEEASAKAPTTTPTDVADQGVETPPALQSGVGIGAAWLALDLWRSQSRRPTDHTGSARRLGKRHKMERSIAASRQ